jgi:hypothetical protein
MTWHCVLRCGPKESIPGYRDKMGGLGLAYPLGQESRTVEDLDVCSAFAGHGAGNKRFGGIRRAGE